MITTSGPKLTLIAPCLNEEKYIYGFLDSVKNFNYPKDNFELLLIDGGSTDRTKQLLTEYNSEGLNLRVLNNEKKTVPYAMNLGVLNSTGDYIVRLDVHTEYPENYLSTLLDYSLKLGAANVGAVCLTRVKNLGRKPSSIMSVLSDRLGVGNSDFRIGTKEVKKVDTVPFGFYRREVFDKVGLYNVKLTRNQDIEFNKRVLRSGGEIFLVPDTYCFYYARENFHDLFINNYLNGKWVVLTIYYTGNLDSVSVRHLVPGLFVLSLLLTLVASYLSSYFLGLFLLILFIYFATIIFRALYLKNEKNSFFFLVTSFITLHFSYGMGTLSGVKACAVEVLKSSLFKVRPTSD